MIDFMKIATDDELFKYIMKIPEKFDSYRSRCKSKNIKFSLTFAQFDYLVRKPCHYCGYKSDTKINGIDRVDPKRGYSPVNCTSCCWTCNRAKSDMSYSDFKEYISRFKSIPENKVKGFRRIKK